MYWQLTDEDGLPSMTIYDVLQDDEGYIWLATANGICRYDGSKVTVFDDPEFKDREIIEIEKDTWNRIWMINLSGQIAYFSEGKIHFLEDVSPLQGKELMKLHVAGNSLWILCKVAFDDKSRKLFSYELSKDQAPKLHSSVSNLNVSFSMMEGDQDNNVIMLGSIKQELYIYRYDSLLNLTSQEFTTSTEYKKWGAPIADFGIYQDQKILALAKGAREKAISLCRIRDTTMSLWYTFEESVKVNGVKMTGSNFWLMSAEGIWTANLDGLSQEDPPKIEKILAGVNANNIILDREGSHWIVTAGHGAIIIPSLSLKQVKVVHNNIPIKEVYSLLPDPQYDRMISGHHEGIVAAHGAAQTPQIIDINRKGEVRDIFQSKDDKFYCVTNNGSVVLDTLLKTQFRYSHAASKKLLIDQNEQFWIGTSSGVYSSPQIKNYKHSKENAVSTKRTYALHEDMNQQIWVGSIDGLYLYENSQLRPFDTQDSMNYFITDFAETADGTLWVSTQTNGVFAIKEHQIIQRYTTNNGLSTNDCKRLFWDGELLWISTNQGLHYLEPNTGKIAHLNKKDGLPSNEVNDVAVLNDQVWVGTSKGLVYFPKNIVHYNTVAPLIYLVNFKIWDALYTTNSELTELSSKQNNLAFEFAGIALKAKNAVSYKYKIIGIDHDWVHTVTPMARYPVVNPGTYRFEVYAINEDGVESEHPAVLVFTVAVPWWKKWWVITLALVGLAGAISYFIHRHLKKENQKRLAQSKIDQLRQKALQTQMNPHFIFNALSAIQKSMTTNEQEKALLYLSQFAKLIRSIFEYSKREVITLEEEIDFLHLYLDLEKLRFKNKIIIDFSVDANLEQHLYSTLLPPLLLQPLVENAFKHGLFHMEGAGHLQISFSKKGNYLCFLIEDNGVGRDWAKQVKEKTDIYQGHESSGIFNIEERLRIINAGQENPNAPMIHIEDLQQDGKPSGTRIQVYIYYKQFDL